jgi:hypothetical protein
VTLPRSAADVLSEHVTLEVECIDRMYLNVYVPKLQFVEGVVFFLRHHRGQPFASSALLEPISRDFIAGLYRFAQEQGVPVVDFVKGQRKDDLAHQFLAELEGEEGVLFMGRAQEKAPVFRTEKRRNPETGATYPWIVRTSAMVNHLLHLRRRFGLRAVLHQVLLVLPLHREAVHQRQRVGQAPGGEGRDRLRGARQRLRRL